jgi:hypothetical protein
MAKSDDTRTLDVLEDWCGLRPPNFTKALIDLWEETRNNPRRPHTSLDFQPDGVEDLIERLKSEFRNPPGRRITLTPRSFDPNGRVKTVNDLMDAVAASDALDGTPRYLFAREFYSFESATGEQVYRGDLKGWASYMETSLTAALDSSGHVALSSTWKHGIVPPAYVRTNTFVSGLEFKF